MGLAIRVTIVGCVLFMRSGIYRCFAHMPAVAYRMSDIFESLFTRVIYIPQQMQHRQAKLMTQAQRQANETWKSFCPCRVERLDWRDLNHT